MPKTDIWEIRTQWLEGHEMWEALILRNGVIQETMESASFMGNTPQDATIRAVMYFMAD